MEHKQLLSSNTEQYIISLTAFDARTRQLLHEHLSYNDNDAIAHIDDAFKKGFRYVFFRCDYNFKWVMEFQYNIYSSDYAITNPENIQTYISLILLGADKDTLIEALHSMLGN